MSKTARQAEHACCGALENGPHKMGCDYKMHEAAAARDANANLIAAAPAVPTLDEGRTKLGPWGAADVVGRVLPTTRVKPNEINGLRAENGPAAEVAHHGRSCRCGPDGCADSRCPGRGEG